MTPLARASLRQVSVPTPRALLLVTVLAAIGVVAAWSEVFALLWRVGLLAVPLLLLADWLLRPRVTALRVERALPALTHVGRTTTVDLVLANTTGASLRVDVRMPWPLGIDAAELRTELRVAAGGEARIPVACVPLRRGRVLLPPIGVGVFGPLGLLEHRSLRAREDSLRVAPGRPAGEVAALRARATSLQDAGMRRTPRRGSEWEFESLRDYVVGDEVRHLDWKASARRCRPVVRLFQEERNAELIVALDCGRLMNTTIDGVRKLDLAMTPLLDVAAVALRRGERVGLLAFDKRVRAYLPPGAGMPRLAAMTAALADLEDDDEPTSHLRAVSHLEERQRRRCLVVVFTDFTDELSARDMYASLAALARRHTLVFVGVGDPYLEAAQAAPATDARAAYQRAVAVRLALERQRTLQRLERLGVHALDAEPRRLSAPLLARYFAVRFGEAS